MQTPRFWLEPRLSFKALVLAPLAFLYGVVAGRRLREPGRRVDAPVICVGNFVVGGAGKTPTAIALAHLLRSIGERPHFLTRGYRGKLSSPRPLSVDPARHGAADVGDEALLLARVAPTFVCADRVEGARAAIRAGASVVVMDDGLQNPSLAKDLGIVAIDAATGVGNGWTMPSGPLRAPLSKQIPLVSLAVVIGDGDAGNRAVARLKAHPIRIFRAKLVPAGPAAELLRARRVLAFAGIGRPEKFFDTLADTGADIVARRSFADHHAFSEADVAGLVQEAAAAGAALVTTEKDRVRLPADLEVLTLPVELEFDRSATLAAALADELGRIRASR
jgi:tetraacyldisaccharide 4'-kinase